MIRINEEVTSHESLRYTTDIGTLSKILKHKTFRCTCLASGHLNDAREKERNGVGKYADDKFIVCFSHDENESVPFWLNYGGKRSEKVQLCFRNFFISSSLPFCKEIANTESGEICIGEELYKRTTSNNVSLMDGKELIRDAFVEKIEVFDVKYKSSSDKTFSKNYLESVDLSSIGFGIEKVAFPDILGKHKSKPWEYEKETRILCTTSLFTENYQWDWIDLYLYDQVFKNLTIIMSPWDTGTQKRQITKIIRSSSLSEEVKDTISIKESELIRTLNFPMWTYMDMS